MFDRLQHRQYNRAYIVLVGVREYNPTDFILFLSPQPKPTVIMSALNVMPRKQHVYY